MTEPARFPVALIGAGDLRALQEFLAAVPADSGIAYLIVAAASVQEEWLCTLQQSAPLPICLVDDTAGLAPDCICLLPPTRAVANIQLPGRIDTVAQAPLAPIDACFQQMAPALGAYALGVVLSGPGADGALGLTQLREMGGLAAVEATGDTAASAMPLHALEVRPADLVLPAAALPAKLVAYSRRFARQAQWQEGQPLPPLLETQLARIAAHVLQHTGEDVSSFQSHFLLDRIEKRRQLLELPDLAAYVQVVGAQATEACLLRQEMLSSAAQFWREPQSLAALADDVLVPLLHAKSNTDQVRVWVAGCASGEEAYTICILLLETAARLGKMPEIRLFATDSNEDAIHRARGGVFPATIAAEVQQEWLDRYFQHEGESYRISPLVRQHVIFAPHNLFQTPPFLKLDLIVCRNLLSSLKAERQEQLAALFFHCLQPGGYLLTGAHEEVQASYFRALVPEQPLYQRQPSGKTAFAASAVPMFSAVTRAANKPSASYEAIYNRRLQHYAPPGLLVDVDLNIVYYSAGVSAYVHQPGGAATEQVLQRVRSELREALAAALAEAAQTGLPVRSQPILLALADSNQFVQLAVEPVGGPGRQTFLLVLFYALSPPFFAEPVTEERISHLEAALAAAYQNLQRAGEKYATVNEELSATNEELMVLNEELSVKAAELERSKGELLTVNEELMTINRENQRNIEQLRLLTANLQNLMAATNVPTLFLDSAMRIRWFSPALHTLFNVLHGDEGRPLAHITHRLHYDHFARTINQVMKSAEPYECEILSKDNAWFFMRVLPYRTVDQQIDGAVITFFDVTERKRAQAALLELNANLEQRVEERTLELARSNRELDQFAYVASHDLKAPLRAVTNLAEWIEKDNAATLSAASQEHLVKLRGRIARMDRLLEDLLTYSRVGRQRHAPEWVDTGALIRSLRYVLLVPDGFRIEPHAPLPVLHTERVPLEMILRNLIGNAVKHHDRPAEGLVEIFVEERGDWVEFVVKDNGPGIALQHHERIFQIFQSLRPRDEVEGSGMGLAIAKKAVEGHGGHLQVESQPGQGATFRFTWPKEAAR